MGDINTPILHINKGVVIQGKITITGGQKKDTKKIVEESYSTGPIMPPLSSKTTKTKKQEDLEEED